MGICHKLMQYNRVGLFPIDFSWGISRCMYSYLMSPTTNPAAVADTDFFAQLGRGLPHDLIQYNRVWVKWFIF